MLSTVAFRIKRLFSLVVILDTMPEVKKKIDSTRTFVKNLFIFVNVISKNGYAHGQSFELHQFFENEGCPNDA